MAEKKKKITKKTTTKKEAPAKVSKVETPAEAKIEGHLGEKHINLAIRSITHELKLVGNRQGLMSYRSADSKVNLHIKK